MFKSLRTLVLTIALIAIATFSAYAWPAPTIVSPSNGAQTFTGLTLDWSAVANSTEYEIQIDTSINFNSSVFFSATKSYINSNGGNTDTEHFADDLFFGTVYYWRVRAYIAGDTSAWVQQNFITRDLVTQVSPASGITFFAGVTLDWSAHTGVDFYDVEADTTTSFNSPLYKTASKAYINSNSSNTDTEHFLDDILFGTTYYWRVRARNAVDTSMWSTPWSLNTIDEVLKSAPTSGSNTWTGVTLDWLAYPGVDFYYVEADTSSLYNSPALKTASKSYINSNNNNTDTQHFLDDTYFGATYYWHVRASNAIDTTGWGTEFNFTTNDFVTLVSPADGATNVNGAGITLNWNAHNGIDFYQLQIDTTPLFNSTLFFDTQKTYINSNNSNPDTQHSTGALLASAVYFWRVRAINAVDTSSWTTWSFSTTNCAAPGTINGAAAICFGSTATYSVTPVAGANSYNWTLPSGWSGTSTTESITVTANNTGGNLSVTVNNACGVSVPSTLNIGIDSLIGAISSITGPANVCENNLASYLIPSVTGATGYVWTVPSGWTGSSNTNNLLTTPANISGSVSVYAINACDTTSTQSISVTTSPLPLQPGFILGDTIVCYGTTNVFTIDTVAGAAGYIWSIPSGWTGSSTSTSISTTVNNTSGVISVSSLNSCGTSLAQTQNVIVNTVDTSVSVAGIVLTSNAISATYQWINCDSSMTIPGEVNASFTPISNGNYAVIVNQNGCTDTSACIAVTSVGVSEIKNDFFNVYPNPSSGIFNIETSTNNCELYITDVTGRTVLQSKLNNTKQMKLELLPGFYFVTISYGDIKSTLPLIINKNK